MSSIAAYAIDTRLSPSTAFGVFRQLRNLLAAEHGKARRRQASIPATRLLDWSRKHLPRYFRAPASRMHRWLAAKLESLSKSYLPDTTSNVDSSSRLTRSRRRRCDQPQPPTPPGPNQQSSLNNHQSPSPIHHSSFINHHSTKLNVLAPRGAAKSTLGTLAFVLKAALEKVEPYIWIISDTKHQARTHLENIKAELVENRSLAQDYSAAARGPVWRNNRITLRNGVTIEAFGAGQRVRGQRHREHRPSLIVCDDLQNDSHILSRTQRQHSRDWFHGTLMKAGTADTKVVNLATALHRDALAMELHRTPGWNSRLFPAIVRWPDNTALWQQWEAIYTDIARQHYKAAARQFYDDHRAEMDAGAVLLWPEVEDLYTLMCMRTEGGRTAFEREKQNSPINPELCEWPEDCFGRHIWFDQWPANLIVKTMALDPSKGADSRRGDYSAMVALGVDRQGVLYIEADLARRSTPDLVAAGADWFRRFRPDVFAVEANQFQDLLAVQFESEFRRQGLLAPRPLPLENKTPKQVRIRRLGPYLATRRLRFKTDSPGTKLLVEQLMQFPIADYDDGPDALEMALRLAEQTFAVRTVNDGLGNRLPVG
jgi:hypothetical protein